MLTRRSFIAACSWFGAGQTWPAARSSSAAGYAGLALAPPVREWLVDCCAGLRCSNAMSAACSRALPKRDASPTRLGSLILADLLSAGRDCTSSAALGNSIREQVRHDFDRRQITIVDGWILSRTEARIYALAPIAENSTID